MKSCKITTNYKKKIQRIPMNLKKVDRLTPDKIVKEQWETLMKSYEVMNNHNEL